MITEIYLTKDDVDNITVKLDEFSSVLSDREYALLLAVFAYAKPAIADAVAKARAEESAPRAPLSSALRATVEAGIGSIFTMNTGEGSDAEGLFGLPDINVNVKTGGGTVHKEIHKTGGKKDVHKETHKEGGGTETETKTEGGGSEPSKVVPR